MGPRVQHHAVDIHPRDYHNGLSCQEVKLAYTVLTLGRAIHFQGFLAGCCFPQCATAPTSINQRPRELVLFLGCVVYAMANHVTTRTREKPTGDEEAAQQLKLGEFANVPTLTLSEARLLINAVMSHRKNPPANKEGE